MRTFIVMVFRDTWGSLCRSVSSSGVSSLRQTTQRTPVSLRKLRDICRADFVNYHVTRVLHIKVGLSKSLPSLMGPTAAALYRPIAPCPGLERVLWKLFRRPSSCSTLLFTLWGISSPAYVVPDKCFSPMKEAFKKHRKMSSSLIRVLVCWQTFLLWCLHLFVTHKKMMHVVSPQYQLHVFTWCFNAHSNV